MEDMKELNPEEMDIVTGGISRKEKMRRKRLKKFQQQHPPVVRKLGCDSDKPASEGSMSVSEYVDAHKDEFIIQFPDMDDIL